MNTPTVPSSVPVVNDSRYNAQIIRNDECTDCHYALYPNTGRCSNFECPRYERSVGPMTGDQILREYAPPRLFHGRHWGSWSFDTERLVLVHNAEPVTRGHGNDEYVAFLGDYEIDVERIRQSSQALDWIFQIRGKAWATSVVMRDLIEALDDIFEPQASLCSCGTNKVISNPTAFLKHRIATVGNGPLMRDAA